MSKSGGSFPTRTIPGDPLSGTSDSWNEPITLTRGAGSYTLTATAYDNAGNSNGDSVSIILENQCELKITDVLGSYYFYSMTDLDISNGFAYITQSRYDGLTIVDVSNPNEMNFIKTFDVYNLELLGITIVENLAYVVADEGVMVIIDLSNPTNPNILGKVNLNSTTDSKGIKISGNFAYVASIDSFTAINISDPTNPSVVDVLSGNNFNGAKALAISGDFAYVVGYIDYSGPYASSIFTVVDISNPSNLSVVHTFAGDGEFFYFDDIAISGNYAYAENGSLYAFDISDPTNPLVVDILGSVQSIDLTLDGSYVYLASYFEGTLSAVDISDPTDLTIADKVTSYPAFHQAYTVTSESSYAYVLTYDGGKLSSVKVCGGL